MGLGNVNYSMAMFLLIGGVPGVIGGFSVNQKVPQFWLRRFINIFILVLGIITLVMAVISLN